MAGAVAFASALLLGLWQAAFVLVGWISGDWTSDTQGLLRASVLAAVAATLAIVGIWRSLSRAASRSLAATLSMISVGVTGTYWLLPDVAVHTWF